MSTRKNFQKAIDGMQSALETESKGKAEALRIKKYHQQIREGQAKLEEEQRTKESVRDLFLNNERRSNAAQNALEEARTLLEQADRARRMTEQELSDTNE